MKSPISLLTMTTDWGLSDHYVGSFKGHLLKLAPDARIIDISHSIEPFDILRASYLVRNSFINFPERTVHFISLNSSSSARHTDKQSSYLAVKCKGHILIGKDNGIFSLILGNEPCEVFRLSFDHTHGSAELAKLLATCLSDIIKGTDPEKFGERQESFQQSYLPQATIEEASIRAVVIYIDHFGNAMVNVKKEDFDRARKGRSFLIHVRRSEYNIKKISESYEDAVLGEIVAFFNEDGYLEIALNQSSAAGLLGIKVMDTIRIEFHD